MDASPPALGAPERLRLYREAAAALGAFFGRFTSAFCADCLEVTRRHHRGDPRADVELLEGVFPGCCHAGVGDALWVPRSGEAGRFPPDLASEMCGARAALPPGPGEPLSYRVRERGTGRLARGVACHHLGPGGCRLGDLKGPLCVAYLCEPAREAIAAAAGWELVGDDTDDFAGALAALRAAVAGGAEEARARLEELRDRLGRLTRALERWEAAEGTILREAYSSSAKGSRPSEPTR